MDSRLYKDYTTSRGIKYHYFFSPAGDTKPTLAFFHGFPSTARDWRHIVPYFGGRGYGIIAPDMLGFGDTDKPTDPAAHIMSLVTKDIVEIINSEKLDKVIAIGHDWGCRVVSRLASFFPEKVTAYAWLAVPYTPPMPLLDFSVVQQRVKQVVGYDLFGYWLFFSKPDADKIIQEHIDSFVSILWPNDPIWWKDRLAPEGTLEKTLLEDFQRPLPPYLTEEDKQEFVATFSKSGFTSATSLYKNMTNKQAALDDQQIPPERAYPPASAPIFYGAAIHDYICLAANGHAAFNADGFKNHSVTIKDYDADHWLILSKADEINHDLEAWIEGFASTAKAHI